MGRHRRLLEEARVRIALKLARREVELLRAELVVLREENARLKQERDRLADLEMGELRRDGTI